MTSPLDAYADLIGKTVRVENADNDMLNVVDVDTGTRYHIESTGKLLTFVTPKLIVCSNCQQPFSEHCTKHLIPCCPGHCTGTKRGEQEWSQP